LAVGAFAGLDSAQQKNKTKKQGNDKYIRQIQKIVPENNTRFM